MTQLIAELISMLKKNQNLSDVNTLFNSVEDPNFFSAFSKKIFSAEQNSSIKLSSLESYIFTEETLIVRIHYLQN